MACQPPPPLTGRLPNPRGLRLYRQAFAAKCRGVLKEWLCIKTKKSTRNGAATKVSSSYNATKITQSAQSSQVLAIMATNTLKRNIFTEKLFEAIEEPWSNESTPSSTPAKQSNPVPKSMAARLTVDIPDSGAAHSVMHPNIELHAQSFEDEPDFIVWKLAEKLYLYQNRKQIATAFVGWVTEFYRSVKSKRLSQKARILNRRKLQLKMFNSWYGSVILISGFAKKKTDVAKFVQSNIKRRLQMFFGCFKRLTLSAHSIPAMDRRYRCRLLRTCIEQWRKLSINRAKNYTKSLKMAYKLCLRASLRAWLHRLKSKRRLEAVLRVFRRRLVRKSIIVCFKRWHQSKMASLIIPSKNAWLAHHLDLLHQKRSTAAIKEWRRVAAHNRQARSVFLKTLCRKMFAGHVMYASWCMQTAMSAWLENTRQRNVKTRPISARQTRPTTSFSMSTIFNRWSKCCVVDRRTKSMALRHRLLKTLIVVKRCYHIWKTMAKSYKIAEKKASSVLKYRCLNRKIRIFMVWRHALVTSAASAVLKADSFRSSRLKRKHLLIWNKWKQRTMRRIMLERSFKSRARQRVTMVFSLRALFWEWKMGILSEQFFVRYLMKRFWGLWREMFSSISESLSPVEAPKSNAVPVKLLEKETAWEARNCSVAQIYKRKVLSLAVNGWAWICSQHSMLLEKLQIAFMIRSSIRTCRTCFAAWSNETVKISKTVVTPIRPVTPNLAPMLFEPSETDQRSFEILNIALVERIFWCSSNKCLVRKSLKHWAKVSRESGMMRMKARYRVIKFAFFSWVQKVASRVSRLILKCISSAFTVWKCFACQKSALKSIWFAVKAKYIAAQKKRAVSMWRRHTFGITHQHKSISAPGCTVHLTWKMVFSAFQAWRRWTQSTVFRNQDLKAVAESNFCGIISHKCLVAWRFRCRILKQSEQLSHTRKIDNIRKIFRAWSRCTFIKRKANKLIISLQEYQATSLLILCWNAWRAGLDQRNYRTLTLSVTGKLIQKCNAVSVQVRIAWNGWRNFISTRRFVRLAKEKIAHKVYDKANFRNMFRRWRAASNRRRRISMALARVRTTILRRAFCAMKYSIVRSIFFARQYQRISKKCKKRCKDEIWKDALNTDPQQPKQTSSQSDSQPEIGILEEKVLELQSEKIELMEQLKSALQGMKRESCSPILDQGCKKETHLPNHQSAKVQASETNDQSQYSRPLQHKPQEFVACQHPLFPVQSQTRGLQSSSGKMQPPSNSTQQQHPLFPVLSQNERQSGDTKHQDTKVSLSTFQIVYSYTHISNSGCFSSFVFGIGNGL